MVRNGVRTFCLPRQGVEQFHRPALLGRGHGIEAKGGFAGFGLLAAAGVADDGAQVVQQCAEAVGFAATGQSFAVDFV